MQAVVLEKFGSVDHLTLRSVEDPRPGPGEVLLRVRACGVCYHDVINRRGSLPRTSVPAILGHEVAGEVIEVGPGVQGWNVGDRAATLQRMSCGSCAACEAGRSSLCKRDNRFFGEELQGGYAGLMVAPTGGIGRVPEGMPWAVAATVCCTAGTAVHVVRTRGRVRRGEAVLITHFDHYAAVTGDLPEVERRLAAGDDVNGRDNTGATPLLLALVAAETTDLVFALDSIPAVFAVTDDPFLVFSSNICALLGLRALYFVVRGALTRLRYLKPGLAGILLFVGMKMLLYKWVHLPTGTSLLIISGILGIAIVFRS